MLKTSAYFQQLCDIILENYGTIDKFIGDAIMAFWNAPVPDDKHTLHACRAMLLCRQKNSEMNREWAAQGKAHHAHPFWPAHG